MCWHKGHASAQETASKQEAENHSKQSNMKHVWIPAAIKRHSDCLDNQMIGMFPGFAASVV